MTPAPERDAAAVAMLRDLADAVSEVAGRLFGLTPEGGDRNGTHGAKGTGEIRG